MRYSGLSVPHLNIIKDGLVTANTQRIELRNQSKNTFPYLVTSLLGISWHICSETLQNSDNSVEATPVVTTLHYNPRHVPSINMPIFRRTNCIITEQSALIRHTVQPFTESDDTRCCDNTICPPEDGRADARNMSRIVM